MRSVLIRDFRLARGLGGLLADDAHVALTESCSAL